MQFRRAVHIRGAPKVYHFSEKLRSMREHLCLKVKALEHTVRISDTSLGFSDLLMNADNKG